MLGLATLRGEGGGGGGGGEGVLNYDRSNASWSTKSNSM